MNCYTQLDKILHAHVPQQALEAY